MEKEDEITLKKLTEFGLSRKEAGVYLAILELGRGTVSQISRKAGINRTTGYDILSSLSVQGLVSISGKEPKQEYIVESPENFVPLLEAHIERLQRQIAETEKRKAQAKEFIPQLKSRQKVGDRPQVKFFEGIDGLKYVFEDSLRAKGDNIIAFSSIEDQHSVIKDYFPEYYRRRAKRKLFMRAIFPKTQMGVERADQNNEEYRESVFVPSDTYGFHPAINIYDNKVMIASWREKLAIIIESAEIADAMKKIFELAWVGAKQLDKERALGTTTEAGV